MLNRKIFQAAALAIAVIGFGLAPAGDAMAGSCKSDRSSHDRWQSSKHDGYRYSHRSSDRWHNKSHRRSYGTSTHYRSNSHRDYSHSRTKVTYRNDNVRLSVRVGSDRSYGYDRPRYRSSCRQTVVYHNPQPATGYWKRVYHSPVYETRYDSCGRPYRVCVRAGYYERVWVDSSYCR